MFTDGAEARRINSDLAILLLRIVLITPIMRSSMMEQ